MQKRIFRLTALAVLCTVLLSALGAGGVMYFFLAKNTAQQLKEEASYITAVLDREENDVTYLKERNLSFSDTRVTWVSPEGEVLFDSALKNDALENHLERPEIKAALQTGFGQSIRRSESWARTTQYAAMRLSDGSVVRVARSIKSVLGMLLQLAAPFALMMLPLMLLVFWLARGMTRRIVAPLNSLSLDAPLDNNLNDPELTPLLTRIDKQNKLIKEQIGELTAEKEKLEAITENMHEAMVLLDQDGRVISLNSAGQALFSKKKDEALWAHFLNLTRLPSVQQAAEKALSGVPDEVPVDMDGKTYLLLAGPAFGKGAVLIFLDITEKQNAEQMRREFSANVSHELKTPLTAISGYAEIMSNGLAKPEDMRAFAGRIHQEAQRLLTLINDIIRLSRLDEGVDTTAMARVDVWDVLNDVAARLSLKAREKGIELVLSGDSAFITGARHVIDEIIFNLMDNAIRYNHENGHVTGEVLQSGARILLTVSDTGIGIPPEDREKVFERFYRVDKSHSKETGGTGLGLSIVKHGVKLHGGILTLRSQEGAGTSIRIAFPREASAKRR